jgi:hypothetical protein
VTAVLAEMAGRPGRGTCRAAARRCCRAQLFREVFA